MGSDPCHPTAKLLQRPDCRKISTAAENMKTPRVSLRKQSRCSSIEGYYFSLFRLVAVATFPFFGMPVV